MAAQKASGEECGLWNITEDSLLEVLTFLPWEERVAKEEVSPRFHEVCSKSWRGVRDLDLLPPAIRLFEKFWEEATDDDMERHNDDGDGCREMTDENDLRLLHPWKEEGETTDGEMETDESVEDDMESQSDEMETTDDEEGQDETREEYISQMLTEVWDRAYRLQCIVLPICDAFWSPQFLEALAQLPPKPLKRLRLVGKDCKIDGEKRCSLCLGESHTNCPGWIVKALNRFLAGGTGEELETLDLDFTEKLVPMEFPQELLAKTLGACPKLKKLRSRGLQLETDLEILGELPRSIEDVDMNGLTFKGAKDMTRTETIALVRKGVTVGPIRTLDHPNLRAVRVALTTKAYNKINLHFWGDESIIKSLRVLDLSKHKLSPVPDAGLYQLQLEELYLNWHTPFFRYGYNKFEDDAPLKKTLKIVGFAYNGWVDGWAGPERIGIFADFPNLEQLDLRYTFCQRAYKELKNVLRGCKKLRVLCIGGRPGAIRDEHIKMIANEGAKLEQLDISASGYGDQEDLTEEALIYLTHAVGSSENRHLALYATNAFMYLRKASKAKKNSVIKACEQEGVELILNSNSKVPFPMRNEWAL